MNSETNIHPSARYYVERATIHPSVRIEAHAKLGLDVEIGAGSIIGVGTEIGPLVKVGRGVHIGAHSRVTSNLADGVTIGNFCVVDCPVGQGAEIGDSAVCRGVRIGAGSKIGWEAVISEGARVCARALVGPKSFIGPNATILGKSRIAPSSIVMIRSQRVVYVD